MPIEDDDLYATEAAEFRQALREDWLMEGSLDAFAEGPNDIIAREVVHFTNWTQNGCPA